MKFFICLVLLTTVAFSTDGAFNSTRCKCTGDVNDYGNGGSCSSFDTDDTYCYVDNSLDDCQNYGDVLSSNVMLHAKNIGYSYEICTCAVNVILATDIDCHCKLDPVGAVSNNNLRIHSSETNKPDSKFCQQIGVGATPTIEDIPDNSAVCSTDYTDTLTVYAKWTGTTCKIDKDKNAGNLICPADGVYKKTASVCTIMPANTCSFSVFNVQSTDVDCLQDPASDNVCVQNEVLTVSASLCAAIPTSAPSTNPTLFPSTAPTTSPTTTLPSTSPTTTAPTTSPTTTLPSKTPTPTVSEEPTQSQTNCVTNRVLNIAGGDCNCGSEEISTFEMGRGDGKKWCKHVDDTKTIENVENEFGVNCFGRWSACDVNCIRTYIIETYRNGANCAFNNNEHISCEPGEDDCPDNRRGLSEDDNEVRSD